MIDEASSVVSNKCDVHAHHHCELRRGRGSARARPPCMKESVRQSARDGGSKLLDTHGEHAAPHQKGTTMLHLVVLVSALSPPQLASTRRALLTNAAAAVTFSVPFAAHAKGAGGDTDFIKDILEAARGYKDNPVGDAAIYTPKARIDGGA